MIFTVNFVAAIWISIRRRYYIYECLLAKRKLRHARARLHNEFHSWASNKDRGCLLPEQDNVLLMLDWLVHAIDGDIAWYNSIFS